MWINTPNILKSIKIGPRQGLNPRPEDRGAPTLPTLPSGSVWAVEFNFQRYSVWRHLWYAPFKNIFFEIYLFWKYSKNLKYLLFLTLQIIIKHN